MAPRRTARPNRDVSVEQLPRMTPGIPRPIGSGRVRPRGGGKNRPVPPLRTSSSVSSNQLKARRAIYTERWGKEPVELEFPGFAIGGLLLAFSRHGSPSASPRPPHGPTGLRQTAHVRRRGETPADFCLTSSLRRFNLWPKRTRQIGRHRKRLESGRERACLPRLGVLRSIVRQGELIPADGFDSSPTPRGGEAISSAGVHEALRGVWTWRGTSS
jgi:hypothetical protein